MGKNKSKGKKSESREKQKQGRSLELLHSNHHEYAFFVERANEVLRAVGQVNRAAWAIHFKERIRQCPDYYVYRIALEALVRFDALSFTLFLRTMELAYNNSKKKKF